MRSRFQFATLTMLYFVNNARMLLEQNSYVFEMATLNSPRQNYIYCTLTSKNSITYVAEKLYLVNFPSYKSN